MVPRRAILFSHFCTLLRRQSSPEFLTAIPTRPPANLYSSSFSLLNSICGRSFSLSAQFERTTDADNDNTVALMNEEHRKKKIRLDVLYREVTGLSEKVLRSEIERESDLETRKLKDKLRKLEEDVRNFDENRRKELESLKALPGKDKVVQDNKPQSKGLHVLFANKKNCRNNSSGDSNSIRIDNSMLYKELSPDMEMFARHLYKEGYFNGANFLPRNKFDVTCFENSYGRNFIQFAAEKFGRDYQEIAKWLSGSDLKKVALFGCPSLGKKSVFSAKRLRAFFRIHEELVCSKCSLRQSCNFVNQGIWKDNTKNVNLSVVMRMITLYALDSVHPQLIVPEEIKASVSKLVNEVLNLSKTVSRGF